MTRDILWGVNKEKTEAFITIVENKSMNSLTLSMSKQDVLAIIKSAEEVIKTMESN